MRRTFVGFPPKTDEKSLHVLSYTNGGIQVVRWHLLVGLLSNDEERSYGLFVTVNFIPDASGKRKKRHGPECL